MIEVRLEEESVNSIQNTRKIISAIQQAPGFYQRLTIVSSAYHLRRLVQTWYAELKHHPKPKLLAVGADGQTYDNVELNRFFQELVTQWQQHRSQRPVITKMIGVDVEVFGYVLAKLGLQGLVSGMVSNIVAGKKSTI